MSQIHREITPLTQYDCFTVFTRNKRTFDFPVHFHEEYEINFILNGKGAKRVIGDHTEEIGDVELVLVGSNLPHGWVNGKSFIAPENPDIFEICIQFHKDLFDEKFLRRNQLFFLRNLLEKSSRGIAFSTETALKEKERLEKLSKLTGLDSVLELISILHDLSISRNMRLLSDETFTDKTISYNSRRIQNVFEFMRSNFDKAVTLTEVAQIAGMTEVSFSRFIKKRTGKTFIDSLNEIRLGHASRMLIDTTHTIAEIAYNCGFNNLSYFNRLFKSRKGSTPKEFREEYAGTRTFI